MIKKDLTEMCKTMYMDELATWVDINQHDYVLVKKDQLKFLEEHLSQVIDILEECGIDYEEILSYKEEEN